MSGQKKEFLQICAGLAVIWFISWAYEYEKKAEARDIRLAQEAVVRDAKFDVWLNPGTGMIVENKGGFELTNIEVKIPLGDDVPAGFYHFDRIAAGGRKWFRLDDVRDGLEKENVEIKNAILSFRHGEVNGTRDVEVSVDPGAHWLDTVFDTDLGARDSVITHEPVIQHERAWQPAPAATPVQVDRVKMGQTVTRGEGIDITVVRCFMDELPSIRGTERLLFIEVLIDNKSNITYPIDAMDFILQDAQGFEYECKPSRQMDHDKLMGVLTKIGPGHKTRGYIAYDVTPERPDGMNVQLRYGGQTVVYWQM